MSEKKMIPKDVKAKAIKSKQKICKDCGKKMSQCNC